MNWIEAVNEIKKAQENNRLVVFVGAGVSKNSNMPSWGELIKQIAEKIGYVAEIPSYLKRLGQDTDLKAIQNWFTQDEYLRIPEYFYQTDKSTDHRDYYQLIKEALSSSYPSNSVDSEIFNLLPHHIITTNYDSLLEKAVNPLSQLYTVVSEDKELLSKPSDRYIIKMHGDINIPESIVLKESDYINYEQEHPLISTFIKSLLVNHTFMFVGYSLNDYNLNLIIGWINYFQKHYKITERPKSFLIDTKAPLHHECIRQESRNIFVINIADLPKELTDNVKVPEDLTAIPGKQLFTFLRIITDEDMLAKVTPFEEILRDKFSVFDSYNKVSHDDLINTQDFGPVLFQGTEMTFYHYEDYKRLEEVIKNGDSKILDVFQRAGISSINCYEKIEEEIEIPVLDETDNMFMLYINNDYKAIEKSIEGIADPDERLYYLKLINIDQSKIYKAIEESEQSLKRHDFTSILLSKMRYRLSLLTLFDRQQTLTKELDQLFHTVPMRYQDSTKYLRMLFESMSNKLFEMQKVLDEQDKRNKYGSNTWESGHAFKHIWKLKASAYNYYFFVKKNYLPVDYFTDPRRFLRYYIQAILCSYMPVDTNTGNDLFGFPTHHEHYKLNSIDLDIFIKFSDSKELESWLKKYSVNCLEFEGDVDLVQKYKNLCESYVEIHNASWKDSLLNFTRILCLAGLNDDDKRNAFSILVSALEASITKSDRLIEDLFEALDYYYNNCTINGADLQKKQLLHVLLIEEVINVLRQSHNRQWSQMINKLFVIADTDLQTELIQRIDNISDINKKASYIHRFRKALPDNYYEDWLKGNVNEIWTGTLFGLIVSNQIGFTTEIQQRFVDVIESEVLERIKVPGIRSYPDRLSETIEQCIIMKLIGISFDISLLGKYAEYSSCLQFILNPLEFNYNQVDTRNVMWQNLMYSDEYGKYFKMNKETILTDELQLVLRGGLATVAQQKVVYGLLLDRDELRDY